MDQLVEDRSTRHDLVHDLMQLFVSSRQPSMYRLTSLPAEKLLLRQRRDAAWAQLHGGG